MQIKTKKNQETETTLTRIDTENKMFVTIFVKM